MEMLYWNYIQNILEVKIILQSSEQPIKSHETLSTEEMYIKVYFSMTIQLDVSLYNPICRLPPTRTLSEFGLNEAVK